MTNLSEDNKKKLAIGIFLFLVAGAAISYFVFKDKKIEPPPAPPKPIVKDFDPNGPCPGAVRELEMQDVYLRGIIEKGTKYKVIYNYYKCNKPKQGDLVAFMGGDQTPVARIVRAVEGDKYELLKDKQMHAWNIKINGKILMDQGDKRKYFFGGDEPPTLSLYLDQRPKGLKENEIILLSSWAPGDRDSSIFGIYTTGSLIGKIVLSDDEVPSEAPVGQ